MLEKQKQKQKQKRVYFRIARAFSMIEILIVLAIISIMTGALVMSISQNKDQKEVESYAGKMVGLLRSLQNDMVNGKIIDGEIASNVTFVPRIATRYLYQYSNAFGMAKTFSVNIDKGVVCDGCVSTSFVEFSSPSGGIKFWRPTDTFKSIKYTKGTAVYYVCVYVGGNIFAQKDECTAP